MESSTVDSEYTEDNLFSSAVDSELPLYSDNSGDENYEFDAATYDDKYTNESSDSSNESVEEGFGEAVFKEEIERMRANGGGGGSGGGDTSAL